MEAASCKSLQADQTAVLASDHNGGRAGTSGHTITLITWPKTLWRAARSQRFRQFTRMLDIDKQGATIGGFGNARDFSAQALQPQGKP